MTEERDVVWTGKLGTTQARVVVRRTNYNGTRGGQASPEVLGLDAMGAPCWTSIENEDIAAGTVERAIVALAWQIEDIRALRSRG